RPNPSRAPFRAASAGGPFRAACISALSCAVMNPDDFRRHGHSLVDWIADYLEHAERYPVLARVKPGEITTALPSSAPEDGEPFETIMADFERVLVPGLTHWNHPGF